LQLIVPGPNMYKLKTLVKKRLTTREPILPPAAHAHANKLARNPQAAFEFLIRCGIYRKDGKLNPHYRA